MRFGLKKFFAFLLIFSMFFSLIMPVNAKASEDISGHWAAAQLSKWIEKGVFSGYPDGSIRPDSNITRAEFVVLLDKVWKFTDKSSLKFSDVSSDAWYADAVSRAVAAGIIAGYGNGKFGPDDPISRQQAAVVLSQVFNLEASNKNASDKFSDAARIAPWSRDAINAMVERGYLKGNGRDMIAPLDKLTRAQFAVIMDKMAGELKNAAGIYTGYVAGNLVVNTKDVTLKDMTINGELYLTQGIGDGNVTLDNVAVKGRTIIRGGGENSIIVKNSSLTGALLVIKANGKVRIVASGSTSIPLVQLGSGAKLEEDNVAGKGFENVEVMQKAAPGHEIRLDGDFEAVSVEAPGAMVNVLGGTIGTMEIGAAAAGSTIQLAKEAMVENLSANAAVSVTGQGTVHTANVKAEGVVFEKQPDKIITDSGNGQNGGSTSSGSNGGSSGDGGSQGTIPGTPAGLALGTVKYNSVEISWRSVAGAESYNVYRSTSSIGTYSKINTSPVTANRYADTGLSSGTSYFYKVTAVSSGGESAKSAAINATTAVEPKPGEWSLVWSDEFNGTPGDGVDTGKWQYEIGGDGWGNNELQYCTDSKNNVYLEQDENNPGNGLLTIKAIKEDYQKNHYTSGKIKTEGKFDFTYGKVEMRAKLPYGQGIGSSFWMLASNYKTVGWPNCGEIDIMENNGKAQNRAFGTIHGPGYSAGDSINAWHEDVNGFSNDFHIYSIEWEPNVIRWYVDGQLYETRTPEDLFGKTWVYDHDFFIILGLGVGGDWPGAPDSTTVFPQKYTIDYVRVYQRHDGVYPEREQRNLIQIQNKGNGKYVCTDKQKEDYAYADRGSAGLWETYELKDLGNGNIALMSLVNNKYLNVESATNKLVANKEQIEPSDTFALVDNGDGTYSLKASNGKYLTVPASGPMTATASEIGNSEKFTFIDHSAPDAPTGLNVSSLTNSSASISWTASEGATGYNVYRSAKENGLYTRVNTSAVTETTYTDTGLTAGATYYYKVSAVNSVGESRLSTAVTAIIPTGATAPPAPVGINTTSCTENSIDISWGAVTGATGYNVYRAATSGGGYGKINTEPVTATKYTDTDLASGTAYYYKVTAVNGIGESAKSDMLFASTTGYGAGAKNYSYIISAANGKIVQSDSTDGMVPLKASAGEAFLDRQLFEIIYKADGNVGFASKALNQLVCADSWNTPDYKLLPRTGYSSNPGAWETFTIVPRGDGTVAIRANNGSKYVTIDPATGILKATSDTIGQNEKFIIVTPYAPAQPTGLTVTESLDKSVSLSWTAPAATVYTGYNVYRATTGGGPYTKINTSALTENSYTDTTVSAGTTYYYKVAAVNARGETYSSEVAATTLNGPLAKVPSGLDIASSTADSINLRWNPAEGADSYNVYRSTSRFGTYEKINDAPVTEARYTDTGLSNTAYYYKVTAVNENGESYKSEPISKEIKLFGPNTYIFAPTDSAAEIQAVVTDVFTRMQPADTAQFTDKRYALLFKPGTYNTNVKVGYYTQVAGLGGMPTDTTIASLASEAALPNNNATCNFWRSAENMTVNSNTNWAVSQAVSLRRMQINGNLTLHQAGGWASGGFLADSHIAGTTDSGSQQQWFSRNTYWNKWSGGVWNMVFVGVDNPPAGTWPATKNTTVAQTPVIRETPFLYIDEAGNYNVFVPKLRSNATGNSWEGKTMADQGTSMPIDQFYVAHPGDTAATINAALADGKNLLFTPGIYELDEAIRITNPNTIVLGLGLATLTPTRGNSCIKVADVDGVIITGLLFDAGEVNSQVLLQVGPENSSADHSANPTLLSDLYFRVGGGDTHTGRADTCIIVNSNNVIGDNFWVWRADHGKDVAWDLNTTKNGMVVNGDDVTMYALMVEHFHEYQTLWNGNGGRTYFYQSEIPYDVPNQASWMSHDGNVNGYSSYKVADTVTSHEAWGLGVYSYFRDATVDLNSAIEVPDQPDVKIHNACSVMLAGNPGISHVVNNTGGAVATAGQRQEVTEYCNNGKTVKTPVISPKAGTYITARQVTIACETEGATIRYTTDGTTPTEASTVYTDPIAVTDDTTIKAIAFKNGLAASEVATAVYSIDETAFERNKIKNGTFDSNTDGWGTWSGEGSDGQFSIDNGMLKVGFTSSDGDASWKTQLWQSGVSLSAGKTYVLSFEMSSTRNKSVTVCVENTNNSSVKYLDTQTINLTSDMTTYTYDFVPTSQDSNAKLVFLLGGSSSGNHSIYIDNVMLWEKDTSAPNQVKTPGISPESGTYNGSQTVTISCATEGASIRYTTDGSTPTAATGTIYEGPFTVSAAMTVKAIAYKTGMTDSEIASATYAFTDNYALNKPSKASSGTASAAFDGNPGTRWESDSSDPQWLAVDIGQSASISGAKITWETAAGKTYKIQISNDPAAWDDPNHSSWTDAYTVTNGTGGATLDVSFPAVTGRYVRMYGTTRVTGYGYSIWEFEVYANKVSTPTILVNAGANPSEKDVTLTCDTEGAEIRYTTDGTIPTEENGTVYTGPFTVSSTTTIKAVAFKTGMTKSNLASLLVKFNDNIALNKTATASTGTAANAIDGNTGTRWESQSVDPQWICIDLGESYKIRKVIITWETAAGKDYKIQVADTNDENTVWTDIITKTDMTSGHTMDETLPTPVAGRYIRMYGTARATAWGYSIFEFEVYGTPVGDTQ